MDWVSRLLVLLGFAGVAAIHPDPVIEESRVFSAHGVSVLVGECASADVTAFFPFAHESVSVGGSAIEQVASSDGDKLPVCFPASASPRMRSSLGKK